MDINTLLSKVAAENSSQLKVVSTDFLETLRQDFESLKANTSDFENSGIFYNFDYDVPKLDFEVKSIIIVANECYSYCNLYFNHDNRRVQLKMPGPYIKKGHSSQGFIEKLLNTHGYNIVPTYKIPHKLIAARSGLAQYGRNNITYVGKMGSYISLDVYYSDVPSVVNVPIEISIMDCCTGCKACEKNCAGGAISAGNPMINSKKCITNYNESGTDDFPPFIDITVQDCIYGCINCQYVCKGNKYSNKNISPDCEFDEMETQMLLDGIEHNKLPLVLQQKLNDMNISHYMTPLPRNLKILLNRDK